MSGRISQESIEQVRRAADIVEVISGYLPLKRAGHNFKGLCPFHEEKTPSFMVHPEKQMYYCFGCKEGGSVFTFLTKKERMEFPEVVRMLADRYHVSIRETRDEHPEDKKKTLRSYAILAWTASLYHKMLKSPEGEKARNYFYKRGFGDAVIDRYKLGFAPASWDFVLKEAARKKCSGDELSVVGLAIARDGGGHYDRFRDRLLFPIEDLQGRVVGFGGRAFGDEEPKYLNSPETPLFSKGQMLYGLDRARESARKTGTLLIMEGYTDVISAHENGFTNAVATLGTSLSRDHLRLLRRFADKIVVVYDADTGGETAMERGLELFLEEDMDAGAVSLPEGLDPADLFQEPDGAKRFGECLANTVDLFDFKINRLKKNMDLENPAAVAKAADDVVELLTHAANSVRQAVLVRRTAEAFRIPEEAVRDRLKKLSKRTAFRPAAREESPAAQNVPAPPVERMFAASLLRKPAHIAEAKEKIPLMDITNEPIRQVLTLVYERADSDEKLVEELLATFADDAESSRRVVELFKELDENADADKAFRDCLSFLAKRKRKQTFEQQRSVLREAERGADDEKVNEILTQRQKLFVKNDISSFSGSNS